VPFLLVRDAMKDFVRDAELYQVLFCDGCGDDICVRTFCFVMRVIAVIAKSARRTKAGHLPLWNAVFAEKGCVPVAEILRALPGVLQLWASGVHGGFLLSGSHVNRK
jgi:hypothetical protein